MKKNTWTVYIGFVIALIAALGGAFYPEYSNIAWSIAGIFGFGSIAALRQFINSNGWKTYVVSGITAIAGILSALEVIPPDVYKYWMGIAASLSGVTIQQAVRKVKE